MLLTDSWRPPPAPTRHPVTRTCPPCRGLGSLPRPLIQELAGASADVLCGQSPWMPQLAPPHLTRGFITSSDSQVAEEKKRQPPPPPTQPSPSDTRLLAPLPCVLPELHQGHCPLGRRCWKQSLRVPLYSVSLDVESHACPRWVSAFRSSPSSPSGCGHFHSSSATARRGLSHSWIPARCVT